MINSASDNTNKINILLVASNTLFRCFNVCHLLCPLVKTFGFDELYSVRSVTIIAEVSWSNVVK